MREAAAVSELDLDGESDAVGASDAEGASDGEGDRQSADGGREAQRAAEQAAEQAARDAWEREQVERAEAVERSKHYKPFRPR